jgi:hypothetical protein
MAANSTSTVVARCSYSLPHTAAASGRGWSDANTDHQSPTTAAAPGGDRALDERSGDRSLQVHPCPGQRGVHRIGLLMTVDPFDDAGAGRISQFPAPAMARKVATAARE